MPAYVTPDDLVAEFGQAEIVELTDIGSPRTNEVDVAVAQGACDRAGAEIDAVLAGRYALPLSEMPVLLQYLARDLARYYLHQTEPSKVVQTRYETARQQLRDIQAGRIQLGVTAAGTPVSDRPQDLAELAPAAKGIWRDER